MEAVGWMAKKRARFLRRALPARVWRTVTGHFKQMRKLFPSGGYGPGVWFGLDGLQQYLNDRSRFPTSLGGQDGLRRRPFVGELDVLGRNSRHRVRTRPAVRRRRSNLRRTARLADRLAAKEGH